MAKKAYIGVDGVARKVKKGYLGVPTDAPIYGEQTITVDITADNISDLFDVTNGVNYYFVGSGDTFTSNNTGWDNTTATTTLTAKKDMTVSFNYSYGSETNYDKFTLKFAGTIVANAVSGALTSKSYSGSLTAGQTIEFTYAKDNSGAGNGDKCTFSAMVVTAMGQVQVGTETKSLARKIKKAYIGIGGVARPCWSGGELTYYGAITSMLYARTLHASAKTGDYALFSGGRNSNSYYSSVDAYDSTLTRSLATSMVDAKLRHAGASIGQYAIFAGGTKTSSIATTSSVYVYDPSLSMSTASNLGKARCYLAGAANKKYALFVGGSNSQYSETSYIDTFDESLSRKSSAGGPQYNYIATASVGQYALFAGGEDDDSEDDTWSSGVFALDENLSFINAESIGAILGACQMFGASAGNHAIFAGGRYNASTGRKSAYAYDENLTRTLLDDLSGTKYNGGSASIQGFAVFFGGNGASSTDVYDESLTHTTVSDYVSTYGIVGEQVGNYAVFAGGRSDSGSYQTGAYAFTVS